MESNGKLNGMNEQDPSLYTQSKGGQADSTEDDTSESGSETDLRLASKKSYYDFQIESNVLIYIKNYKRLTEIF